MSIEEIIERIDTTLKQRREHRSSQEPQIEKRR